MKHRGHMSEVRVFPMLNEWSSGSLNMVSATMITDARLKEALLLCADRWYELGVPRFRGEVFITPSKPW